MQDFSNRRAKNNQHLEYIWNIAFSELQSRLLIYPRGMHLVNLKTFLTLIWNSVCPYHAALENDLNNLYIKSHSLYYLYFLDFKKSFCKEISKTSVCSLLLFLYVQQEFFKALSIALTDLRTWAIVPFKFQCLSLCGIFVDRDGAQG